jgi:hypothetical protein
MPVKSPAVLKKEQRAKAVSEGRVVRFERQTTREEADKLAEYLRQIRAQKTTQNQPA